MRFIIFVSSITLRIRALMATDLRVIETNLCYWHMRTKCFDFLGAILQIRETEQKVHLW